jgi:hypothetical protein
MQPKYLATIIAGLFVIIGWNAFLIQRDVKMFQVLTNTTEQTKIKE